MAFQWIHYSCALVIFLVLSIWSVIIYQFFPLQCFLNIFQTQAVKSAFRFHQVVIIVECFKLVCYCSDLVSDRSSISLIWQPWLSVRILLFVRVLSGTLTPIINIIICLAVIHISCRHILFRYFQVRLLWNEWFRINVPLGLLEHFIFFCF